MSQLDQRFWNDRWQNRQTGWDIGAPAPALAAYISQLADTNLRVLIPGCGNAHEAEHCLRNGIAHVTLLDIAPDLVATLRERYRASIEAGRLSVICADFFEHTGQYDLILEQTFFCAISPDLRPQYVRHMHRLLRPGGKLVGLLFNRDFDGGPPFGGNIPEYRTLFEPFFQLRTLAPATNSIAPRAGTECFLIAEK